MNSVMDFSGSVINQEIVDDEGSVLPGYVPYLSLVFKMIITTAILLLSGWVVYTIKITGSLHKPHNIFVANLLISGMIATLLLSAVPCTMMISFQLGVESFLGCFAWQLRFLPFHVNNISLVIIAADKVLAITSPFKHKRMMSARVIAAVISGSWLLAVVPTVYNLVNVSKGVEVLEYGACIVEENSLLTFALAFVLPMITSSILMVILNAHLTIRAYQVHKQIEREMSLSGQSENVITLKKKQHNIRRNRKPIITLLVVVFGSISINVALAAFYLVGRLWITSPTYHDVMEYVIAPNTGLVARFIHPLVYGLYFKQVRKPMIACLKRFVRMSKVNSVAPQP
ncbi:olfactory receptor 8H1-like [Dysidea avara]|uniref:olfactory receptor 8H1-like n=1 Tax=Dysidea avara TaxID=196820 RepID=UPI00331A7D36